MEIPTAAPARPWLRSRLYVPGNRPERIEKAIASEADAVIVDLEDAVPDEHKDAARETAAAAVTEHGADAVVFVRVNDPASGALLADLQGVVRPGLAGVVVPKTTGPLDVQVVDRILGWLEAEHGMVQGSIAISPILETAASMLVPHEIAASSPRVAYLGALSAKGGDVERALGYRWTAEGLETLYIRSKALLAARAAGVFNPISGLWTDVADLDGLRTFARATRGLGYDGMDIIHPSHAGPVNEAFTPTGDELEYDRGLVAAMAEATAVGVAAVRYRGDMVDIAMAVTAQARLDRFAG